MVSCVSSKGDQPAPARLLYQSDWFVKARAFVEARSAPWFILSALHGVVPPDDVIVPYERTLNTMPVEERRQWAAMVQAQLAPLLAGRPRVVFLAGQRYREHLAPALARDGFQIELPMEGLRIGEQLAWLSART
ncbi:MAG: YaaA family protein [Rhizobiaceae bacterium]|nr:MAG: YaaA family protein [Rhizobiaceae bacterium]